ncbi:hypothetical protein ZHAS_00014218 [Anopheles sinensis]|uniref:Uncharacterized protein n=1 Tax=Anopheles sinensis TaxID=74873 RepID=A0A084W7L9_ANOSI|nr:hypothetical protein ZHAS_00014218 [Anopheles sinensis]
MLVMFLNVISRSSIVVCGAINLFVNRSEERERIIPDCHLETGIDFKFVPARGYPGRQIS